MSADALEYVVRPIVEGQIRSFVNDHPEILNSITWYKPRLDKRQTLVNSIAKRILRDLLCPETRVRLMAALVELPTASSDPDDSSVSASGASGGPSGMRIARATTSGMQLREDASAAEGEALQPGGDSRDAQPSSNNAAVCTAAPQCNPSPQARQDMRATSTVQSRAERPSS